MAYLDDVILNDVQIEGAENAARYGKFGLAEAAAKGVPYVDYLMPAALEKLKTIGSNRSVDNAVMKDQEVEVRQVASFDIPANLGEYANYRFVGYDIFSGIKIFPSTFQGTQVQNEKDIQRRILNVMRDMGKAKEEILKTVAEGQKSQVLDFTTQVSQNDGTFVFDAGTDTLSISKAAQQANVYASLQTLMDSNELGGEYDVITSRAGIFSSLVNGNEYGAQNDKNQSWGKVPMANVFESNQIDPASDNFNGWLIRKGALATIDNHPYDFRMGTVLDGAKWSVSDVEMPFINARPNIFTNSGLSDSTSLVNSSDNQMTTFEEMGFWVRFYVVYPYNEDAATLANPIVKIKGLTS